MASRGEIGDRIREFRTSRGLSQGELADMAGIRTATVSDWETGKNYPDFSALLAIADAMKEPIDTILGRPRSKVVSFMQSPQKPDGDEGERLGRTVGLLQAALEQTIQALDEQAARIGRLETALGALRAPKRKGDGP